MIKKNLPLLLVQFFFATALIGQGLGNGSDGSPNIFGIVNSYTYLIDNAPKCSDTIQVNNSSFFNVNDLVLIVQMQGASINGNNNASYGEIINLNNAGNHEYSEVKAIIGNKILLKYPLLFQYDIIGNVQVIKVPQYNNPTIVGTLKCPKWDGKTGGILAIDVTGTLTMNANIDVSATGFRGGIVINGSDYLSDTNYFDETPSLVANALKGEGISYYGMEPFTSGKGAVANAGGGGNSHTAGGGGGANFGCGGKGGWGFPVDGFYTFTNGLGGYALNYSNTENRIFMGGAGGAGSTHANEGTDGGNGGGMVLITANVIEGNGNSIISKGDSSLSTFSNLHVDGIGGAGAGGSIILSTNNITSTLNINVDGGDGGESPQIGAGPGGGGGGGLVWFNSSIVPPLANVSVNGGVAGKSNSTFYGAINGCNGGVLTNLTVPKNEVYPSVISSFNYTEQTPLSYLFTNTSIAANNFLWNFGDGIEDTITNPIHLYKQSGIFPVTLIATDTSNCKSLAENYIITSVPNIFTPNGDGINDYFSFVNFIKEGFDVKIQIFNRWGREVFVGNNNSYNWNGTNNGKKLPAGTYFYIINIYPDNEYFSESKSIKPTSYKGTITLFK